MNDMTHGLDSATLTLGIPGFTYPDLYEPQALARLTASFDAFLARVTPASAADSPPTAPARARA